MAFEVSARAYGRFMGRYSQPLAVAFVDQVGVVAGSRALDVGCGAGALTKVLVDRLGARAVSAIDPSESFVAAMDQQFPDVHVQRASAERLPFGDDHFDATLAQLVVHFMSDPVAGLSQMRRVTQPGGVVAANVWDHDSQAGPLSLFWSVVREWRPDVEGESDRPGVARGDLARLFAEAGMGETESSVVTVEVVHDSFEEWWEPYTFGVGPAGEFVAALDDQEREELRRRCLARVPTAPFVVSASAWTTSWHKPPDGSR